MNKDRLQEQYRRAIAARATGGRDACAAPEALRELAEREGSEVARLATLDHVMACEACQREFALLRAVHAARPPAEKTRTTASTWRPPWLAMAAVLMLMLGGLVLARNYYVDPLWPDLMRGEARSVSAVTPTTGSTVRPPVRVVWHSVDGATRYTLELLDADGAEVYTRVSADTALTLPAELRLQPGAQYQWWVRAHLPDGGERRSAFSRFRVEAR